jgi:hypothetical protein
MEATSCLNCGELVEVISTTQWTEMFDLPGNSYVHSRTQLPACNLFARPDTPGAGDD